MNFSNEPQPSDTELQENYDSLCMKKVTVNGQIQFYVVSFRVFDSPLCRQLINDIVEWQWTYRQDSLLPMSKVYLLSPGRNMTCSQQQRIQAKNMLHSVIYQARPGMIFWIMEQLSDNVLQLNPD